MERGDVVVAGVGSGRVGEGLAGRVFILPGSKYAQETPAGAPRSADLGVGVHDLEGPPGLRQVVAHGQAGLAAADDEHFQWGARGPGAHRAGSGRRATLKLNIMPLWLCSAMWQCAIPSPGLETSSRMSTVPPAG